MRDMLAPDRARTRAEMAKPLWRLTPVLDWRERLRMWRPRRRYGGDRDWAPLRCRVLGGQTRCIEVVFLRGAPNSRGVRSLAVHIHQLAKRIAPAR